MIEAADPTDDSFDPHTESAVRDAAETAKIEVPVKCLRWQAVVLDALHQQRVIGNALAAADNLAVAFRRQHIDTQGHLGTRRVRLHVEGLHLRGIAVHGDRTVEAVGQDGFIGRAEVAAPLEGLALLVQQLHGFVVADAREGLLDQLELREIALEARQFGATALQHAGDHRHDQIFGQLDHIVECRPRHLGFDHPEFRQMPPRLRLLRAKCRAEAVHPSQGHRVGLVVQLPALSQVRRLLVEVRHRKQRGRAFAGGWREDGRVGQDKPAVVKKPPDRGDHFGPDAQDGVLPLGANPQVPTIHQVVDTMFLRRNRVVRREADNLERGRVDLVSAGRTRVGPDPTGENQRRLLGQVVGSQKRGVVDRRFRHDDLDEAAAVAHRQEVDPAARSPAVQPAANHDRLSLVPGDILDVGDPTFVCHLQLPTASSIRAQAACARRSTAAGEAVAASSNIMTPSYPIFCSAISAAGHSITPSNGGRCSSRLP